jgi:TPR repeat protein
MGQQPMSPQEMAWDSPFPGFPGAKKKTSISEEQKIISQMANMDMNGGSDPRRPRTAGSSRSQESARRGPPGGGPPGRGYPPQGQQGGYGAPRPGPGGPPGPGYRGPPKPNGYGPGYDDQGYGRPPGSQPTSPIKDSFGPMSRSMTMPNEMNMNSAVAQNPGQRYPQPGPGDVGPSAPYNGPVGRMPPRPSTATGARPVPQRTYPPADPQQQPYANGNAMANPEPQNSGNQRRESISDLYDDYFQTEPASGTAPDGRNSQASDMPDFDNAPIGPNDRKRGMSIENHMQPGQAMPQRGQVNGQGSLSRTKSQPDFRAQVQPQAATYEMVGDIPPMPNGYPQQGYNDQQYDQYGAPQNGQRGPPPQGRGYGQDYGQPPRGASAGPGPGGPAGRGMPPGPNNYGMPPRSNSLATQQQPGGGGGGLPSHPAPVRAGLIPNSIANQANNKPAPVRNYNGIAPASQPPAQDKGPRPAAPAQPGVPVPVPVTTDELERLKVLVKTQPNDQTVALLLARKLIEASDVLVANIPDQRARNKSRERYVMEAHKILKRLVAGASPNTEAQFFLADCHGRGALGLEPDNKEAFTLYQSAAKAGHAAAAYRTAVCCELGNDEGGGTRKDPLKAIQWYKRAAMLGDTPAMYKMGMIQLKGLLGQPKNPREAIGWLKRAAERADAENPHALHELGLLYESPQPPDGSGTIIRDEEYSLSLFKQAAELGYKFSQYRLGCAYEYGLFNLTISPRDSILWYSRAAVQEEHQSELALSGWYLTGSEGVLQQSDTEAYLWARKAAMAGLAKAEYAMGYFTEVGIGAPGDLEGAKRWYWRAAGRFYKILSPVFPPYSRTMGEFSLICFANGYAAQNFPKARERLEDLKRGGNKPQLKARERISRSKVGKHNEGECVVM